MLAVAVLPVPPDAVPPGPIAVPIAAAADLSRDRRCGAISLAVSPLAPVPISVAVSPLAPVPISAALAISITDGLGRSGGCRALSCDRCCGPGQGRIGCCRTVAAAVPPVVVALAVLLTGLGHGRER